MQDHPYPGGKDFAFTLIDDTDVATVENVAPVYRLFEDLGMRVTKTVWPVACPEGSRDFFESETLEDPEYRDFIVDLSKRGFEIAFHGATMESSERPRTLRALELFGETFGHHPRVYANHAYNRENLYWGERRIDSRLLRLLYGRVNGKTRDYYQGDIEGSRFWWGDQVVEHIDYVRNLTFDEINLLRINPSMPYHDPRRPLVRWWFSATDADSVDQFRELVRPERLDQLEAEKGVCIVATHLGKGFTKGGVVDAEVARLLAGLGKRNGWFPTVGELLDWLRSQRDGDDTIPRIEWRTMQWRWFKDLASRKLRRRLK
jgi:hypothetical protein